MCEIPLIISFNVKLLSLNLNSLDRIFEPFAIIRAFLFGQNPSGIILRRGGGEEGGGGIE